MHTIKCLQKVIKPPSKDKFRSCDRYKIEVNNRQDINVMANFLSTLIFIALIIYAGIAALLYLGQRHLLYFPTPENEVVSEDSIYLHSEDESIKLWRIGSGGDALIYFGGNAEDVALNIPDFKRYFPDYTVYLVNYRGYGGSTGKPTESGLLRDADNIYALLKNTHQRISVIGRSLGSLVALQLAAKHELVKLALVTPFDSVVNVARDMYGIFPVSLLLKDQFDAVGQIDAIRAPILALVAEDDGVIPRKRTNALINKIPDDQLLVRVIEDTNHNNIQNSAAYTRALTEFFSRGAE